ncbi:hypothetical protein ACOME3_009415 [Neoechinorhynchus agilis]
MDNSYKICTICVRDYLKVLTRERLLSNVVQETKIPCETFLAAKMGTPSIITEHIKFFMMMWDKFKCHDSQYSRAIPMADASRKESTPAHGK